MTDETRRDSNSAALRTYLFALVVFHAVLVTAAPASSLHEAMVRMQSAAAGTDHAAFTAALGEAKRLASAAPAGEEKEAAQRALHVYDDLARLWRYSQESSTGAFFEGGELLTMLHAYPGYDRAVAGDTVVAGEHTLYPAAESRAFLAREAARRLATRPEPAAATPAAATTPVEHKSRPIVLRKKPEEALTQKAPKPTPVPPPAATVRPAVVPPSTASAVSPTATAPTATVPTATVPAATATVPTATLPTTATTTALPTNTVPPVTASSAVPTTTTEPVPTTTAPPATEPYSTTSDAGAALPLSLGGMARTVIAIGLIVAAAASLIYLLRSSK